MKNAGVALFTILLGVILLGRQAAAQESGYETNLDMNKPRSIEQPWEKVSFSVGYFLSALDSTVRIGSGLGVDIDVEDALSLEQVLHVARLGGSWRLGNRKHKLSMDWYAFHRSAVRELLDDITIKDKNGEEIILEAGTTVDSTLELDIYKLTYNYSFIQDDRVDISFGAGLFIAPILMSIESRGLIKEDEEQKFTAPLPVLGLGMDVAVTPKWYIRFQSQALYLEYENFTGMLYDSNIALEYKIWKHMGVGMGYNIFRIKLKADGEDYPEINLNGTIGFQYAGLQLYTKAYF